jgi:hypothetical protein
MPDELDWREVCNLAGTFLTINAKGHSAYWISIRRSMAQAHL